MPRPSARFARFSRCAAVVAALAMVLGSFASTAAPAAALDSPMCPVAAGNARLVRLVYLEILDRCPDSGGLAYWTGMLDHGMSRDAFAAVMTWSEERLSDSVLTAYDDILGRAPTGAEYAQQLATLRQTGDPDLLEAVLAGSDEFYERATDGLPTDQRDGEWLERVYGGILHRDPDVAGKEYFLGVMGSPSSTLDRTFVGAVLAHSDENARRVVATAFETTFLRSVDPGGLTYWAGWLRGDGRWQTFQLFAVLLSFPEAYSLAQSQPNP